MAFSCGVKCLRIAAAEVVLQRSVGLQGPLQQAVAFARPLVADRGGNLLAQARPQVHRPAPQTVGQQVAGEGRLRGVGIALERFVQPPDRLAIAPGIVQEFGQGEERIAPFLARRGQLLAVEVFLQEGFGLLRIAHVHRGPAGQQPCPIDGHVARVLLDALLERLQGPFRLAQRELGLAQIDQGLGVPQAGLVVHVQPQHCRRVAEIVAGEIRAGTVPKLLRILRGS